MVEVERFFEVLVVRFFDLVVVERDFEEVVEVEVPNCEFQKRRQKFMKFF